MKKITLLFFVLVSVSSVLYSQGYFEWSEEQIITDTLSDYSNPFVVPIGNDAWMFYQKNEGNSSIWKMNISSLSDNMQLLGSDISNFKNPVFVRRWVPDYYGYLFYLSDSDGYQNIYASKYYDNDSLGTVINISNNSGQQNITEYSVTDEGYISFVIDSVIFAADLKFYSDSVYTENVQVVDSFSSNVNVRNRQIVWKKNAPDGNHIFTSYYEYSEDDEDFIWTSPALIDSIGNSNSLTVSSSYFDWEDEFCWVNDNFIKIFSGSQSYLDYDTINNFGQGNVREISMVNWYILVASQYDMSHFVAFTINQGDQSEIFSSHGEYGWEDSSHISNNSYKDENPKLFFGESVSYPNSYTDYVYCIWQSHINGNIALSMAKSEAFIGSSVDENEQADEHLRVSPNPFHDRLEISYNTKYKNGNLKIFSIDGRLIKQFDNIESSNSWDKVVWSPQSNIPKGVYFVVLSFGEKQFTTKVVFN